ncbi:MAG: helix-hairpin-helix domain-containing protein [Polyangiales bacterium]
MPIHDVDRIADLLALAGESPFRVRAYRNASRMVSSLGKNVRGGLAKGEDLRELPGIGDDLAGKIPGAVEVLGNVNAPPPDQDGLT